MPFLRQREAPHWSPGLAYAVGLIASDGNLSSDGRHVILRSNDRDLVETFRLALNHPTTKIETCAPSPSGFSRKQSFRVQIGDVSLHRWLQSIGLTPRKSKTIGSLNIPDDYFGDFLRGSLDGDGSIIIYTDEYNAVRWKRPQYTYTRIYIRFLSASRPHVLWIQQTIARLYKLHGEFYQRAPRRPNASPLWETRFAKRESLHLLCHLYHKPHLPALERKKETIRQFLMRASDNVDARRTQWYAHALAHLCTIFEVPVQEPQHSKP